MKKTLLLSLLIVSVALAGLTTWSPTDEPTEEVLWENPYPFADLDDGKYASGDLHCQDDFLLTEDAIIEGFECWSLFEDGPMGDYQLTLYDDDGGSPGDQLWQAVPSSVSNTDTGDDAFGYDVYHTELSLDSDDFYQVTSGATYWIEIYGLGDSIFYWVCADGGNMHRNGTDLGADAFFRVLGTINTALETASWGAIKALD